MINFVRILILVELFQIAHLFVMRRSYILYIISDKNCKKLTTIDTQLLYIPSIFKHQPVAVVLEYLLVQVSSASCKVVGSILALHAWKTLTQQL